MSTTRLTVRPDRHRAVAVWVLGCGLALVALSVAVAADSAWLNAIDRTWGTAAHDVTLAHPAARRFWLRDAGLEAPKVLDGILLVIAVGLAACRRLELASRVAVAVLAGALLASAAKLLLARPRPVWADPVTVIGGFSYPSGHAVGGAVFAAVTGLIARELTRGAVRSLLSGFGVVAAGVVSLDRLFLGVHFVSDVVAGVLLGLVVVGAVWLVPSAGSARPRASSTSRGAGRS